MKLEARKVVEARGKEIQDVRDMRVYGAITSDSSAVSAVKLRSLASAFLAGDMEPEAALSGGLHFERVEAAAAAGGEKEEL